jgi:inner membrane protein involved in colicin E2 resistance
VTNFDEVSYPVGATSPTKQAPLHQNEGQELTWNYTDTLDARHIAMDMPNLLNAGPVIARITFFAPVSLALFFGVLVVICMGRGVNLHPMVYAFLAAGFFTFHLMLAYLGDVMPLHGAFAIAASVSLILVCGYLHAVEGRALSVPAVIAQLAYMVAFSYSFFFAGFTGLTLTLTAVATLALLMMATAKVNWETVFEHTALPWGKKAAA